MAPKSDRRDYRVISLDVLRGLVIVVMALDHVRDFFMIASVQETNYSSVLAFA